MKKLLIVLCILCITGCGRDPYKVPDGITIELNNTIFEVYETHTLKDLIQNKDIEITNGDETLNTEETGTHKVTMNYKYKKKKYKYDISYTIKDTEAPIFISASSVKTIEKNNDIYPCNDIVFGDNYDRAPSCRIEGDYDTTTTGVYNVKYIISDSSNNEKTKDLKINVVDKIATSNNNTKPPKKVNLEFEDAIKKYKTDKTSLGIDVSRWQGDIDWQSVKDAGVEFVLMRIGVQSGVDKDISMDSYFDTNIKGAKEVGLPVGIYVYTTATTKEKAKEHARWVIESLKGHSLDFPIAFDWENWKYFREYNINTHDLSETFNTFREEIQKGGYDAMLYSSKFYLENIWTNKTNAPVWLAHYTSNTDYKGNHILWQFSNIGHVNGINADVDLNIYYK